MSGSIIVHRCVPLQVRRVQVQPGHGDRGHGAGGHPRLQQRGGQGDPARAGRAEEGRRGQSVRQLRPRGEGNQSPVTTPLTGQLSTPAAVQELGWKSRRSLTDMCRDMWNWQTKNPRGFAG